MIINNGITSKVYIKRDRERIDSFEPIRQPRLATPLRLRRVKRGFAQGFATLKVPNSIPRGKDVVKH